MKRNFTFEQYLLVGALIGLFAYVAFPIISAVFLGLFLAMVLEPWSTKLKTKKKMGDGLSAFLLTIGVIVCVLLPIIYIAIIVTKDASKLADHLTTFTKPDESGGEQFRMSTYLDAIYSRIPHGLSIQRDDFERAIRQVLSTSGNLLGKILGGVALTVPELLLNLVFVIMALFYGLSDGESIGKFIREILPFTRTKVDVFVSTSKQIVQGVVVGSLIAGLVQGLIIGFGFVILGVPRPLFFGVMTLMFSFVPVLGSLPAGIGGALYLYFNGEPWSAVFMLGFFGLASVADNIVKPLALKGQSELHPLIGFIAVIGGLATFGFAGLFLGPLIAALALVGMEIMQDSRRGLIEDEA